MPRGMRGAPTEVNWPIMQGIGFKKPTPHEGAGAME